jgi:hypothetical protein
MRLLSHVLMIATVVAALVAAVQAVAVVKIHAVVNVMKPLLTHRLASMMMM